MLSLLLVVVVVVVEVEVEVVELTWVGESERYGSFSSPVVSHRERQTGTRTLRRLYLITVTQSVRLPWAALLHLSAGSPTPSYPDSENVTAIQGPPLTVIYVMSICLCVSMCMSVNMYCLR